jgi:benzoylformate decarboxylase
MTAGNGADWLLAALAAEGMPVLFGNPGSTELPLTDALGRQERVRYVLALHEAAAVGMADGYAQATGGPAAVNVHVQPGLANAMSGILNAARGRVPLLVTVGQQEQSMLAGDPFLGGDVQGMARPVAKGAWEARRPGDLPALLAEALRTALTPPRGPVVLSLPVDVQAGPAPPPHVPIARPAPAEPNAEALDRAAALLAGARRPALLAGDGVAHAAAGAALGALAERLGAPIRGEPLAATVPLPTDHPLWRGPLPPFAAEIAPLLEGHDVVLAAGMPVFRLFGPSPGEPLPREAALVHLDADPHEVGRVHEPAVALVGDPGLGLAGLLERLGPATAEARGRRAREAATAADARRAARARVARAGGGERVGPAAFARAVAAAIGPRDLVVDEALTSARALRAVIPRRTGATWLAHRGSALGWGLPAAVGAKLADPGRRVMALQGDGGLLFGAQALWSAAHEGAGLALVVADNGGYEILRAGLEGLTGRPEGAWPGLALAEPPLGLEEICRGYGASAARAERRADLPEAFADLWRRAADGPAALVVAVEGRTPPVGYPLSPSAEA